MQLIDTIRTWWNTTHVRVSSGYRNNFTSFFIVFVSLIFPDFKKPFLKLTVFFLLEYQDFNYFTFWNLCWILFYIKGWISSRMSNIWLIENHQRVSLFLFLPYPTLRRVVKIFILKLSCVSSGILSVIHTFWCSIKKRKKESLVIGLGQTLTTVSLQYERWQDIHTEKELR